MRPVRPEDHRFARFTRISTQRFDTYKTAGCTRIQVDGIHYLSYGTQSILSNLLRRRLGLMGDRGDGGNGGGAGNRTGGNGGHDSVGDDGGGGGAGCDGGNSFPMLTYRRSAF